VKGIPCMLMTSHLESTASHYAERQRQLKLAFELMTKCSPDQTVILGGDLNLRDKEVCLKFLVYASSCHNFVSIQMVHICKNTMFKLFYS